MNNSNEEATTGEGKTPGINFSTLTSFTSTTNPNNMISGAAKGVGSCAVGLACATVLAVAAPIKGSMDGYQSGGVLGLVAGATVGTIVGAVGGALVAIGGVLSCLWQIGCGVIRTPGAIVGSATGQDWDDDIQEWVYYDLKADANNTLNMKDEDYITAVHSVSFWGSVFGTSGSQLEATESAMSAKKKTVLERGLYDVLGIEPEATAGEIKKAYYVKARVHHPDRSPGDVQANARFQLIGEAYQILSDERSRAAYDARGKEAVDKSPKLEANALYAMIFGSENFEPLIGELQLSTQIKSLVDSSKNTSAELLKFRQRTREVECAVLLATKLDVYCNGEEDLFREKAAAEALDLSNSPLGCALLDVIGQAYCDRAHSELNTFSSMFITLRQTGASVGDICATAVVGAQALTSALALQSMQSQAAAKQKEEDDKNGVPESERNARPKALGGMRFEPAESASEEEKKAFKQSAKTVSTHLFGLMWQITKFDIVNTVCNICNKVLHDHSVSVEMRYKRATALVILGQAFCAQGKSAAEGLEDFIDKMGDYTGLYGNGTSPATPSESSSTFSSEAASSSSSQTPYEVPQPLSDVYFLIITMSTKDLKDKITALHGSHAHCLEKADLHKELKRLMLTQASVEDLKGLAELIEHNVKLNELMSSDLFDRDLFIDIILQADI